MQSKKPPPYYETVLHLMKAALMHNDRLKTTEGIAEIKTDKHQDNINQGGDNV